MEDIIEINETTEAMMKSIIDVQQRQSQQINDLQNMVSNIQHSLMVDRKHWLEDEMYSCIQDGYVSFERNKRITSNYLEYVSLGGNGEIRELYEKRYLQLKIK